ncbi:hypothetical protein [Nonomuraea diastatica]|uniref:Uncharacterized protein n=1 Tax=Nonomuraea diastatica TaxID=1848329 RepID=A0A4R4WK06_9ACTN|nr:hypothetical protein [Nonomuraea diastatica]TDD16743.1 hypothetical protein E1294_30160 [Nonomuraea diastatica]
MGAAPDGAALAVGRDWADGSPVPGLVVRDDLRAGRADDDRETGMLAGHTLPIVGESAAVEPVGCLDLFCAEADLADLPAMISRSGAEMAARISEATGRWGVRVTLLDVDDVQAPVRGELIAWANRARETRPGG